MSRTVLIVSYHFPPYGGAGVQRSLALARYLPAFGYTPIVLTGSGTVEEYWTPRDTSLVRDNGHTVIRVDGHEPRPGMLRRRAERLLGLPSAYGRWFAEGAARAAAALSTRVDIVLSELGPYETVEGARRAAHVLRVPWVADLQDSWALDEMWLYPSALHRLADRRRMGRATAGAAAVVMNTVEATRRFQATFGRAQPAVATISNGFFAEDFEGLRPQDDDERFRIVHSGSLHTRMGLAHRRTRRRRELLGGMPVPGVDYLPRSHVFLLEALDALLDDRPELADVVELHLVGPLTDSDRAVIGRRPWVHTHGFLPHDRTLGRLRAADLLFLPMQDMPPGTRAGLVPAKTYEYAASGRPILAAIPDGDAKDLLHGLAGVEIVAPKDVGGMRRALASSLDRWQSTGRPVDADRAALADVRYDTIVRRIAGVLDNVVDERAAVA